MGSNGSPFQFAFVPWSKSDPAPGTGWERLHWRRLIGKPVDILDQHLDHRGRTIMAALQLPDARSQVLIAGDNFPQTDERPCDEDAHLNGPLALQRRGKHHYAVFGESVRQIPASTAAKV